MMGASIETTLDLWASSLREVKKRMRPLFEQDRTALNAGLFTGWACRESSRPPTKCPAMSQPWPWARFGCPGLPQGLPAIKTHQRLLECPHGPGPRFPLICDVWSGPPPQRGTLFPGVMPLMVALLAAVILKEAFSLQKNIGLVLIS